MAFLCAYNIWYYISAIFSIFFNMRKIQNLKKMHFVFYDKFSLNAKIVLKYLIFMTVWKYFMLMAAGH